MPLAPLAVKIGQLIRVSSFRLAGKRMNKRHFDNLARISRPRCRPIPESRTKSVCRQVCTVHALQRMQKRHVGQIRTAVAREDVWPVVKGPHRCRNLQRSRRQAYDMLFASLHSLCSYRPSTVFKVDFIEGHADSMLRPMTVPSRTFKAANRVVVPFRL